MMLGLAEVPNPKAQTSPTELKPVTPSGVKLHTPDVSHHLLKHYEKPFHLEKMSTKHSPTKNPHDVPATKKSAPAPAAQPKPAPAPAPKASQPKPAAAPAATAPPSKKQPAHEEEPEANDDEYFEVNESTHRLVLPMHIAGIFHHALAVPTHAHFKAIAAKNLTHPYSVAEEHAINYLVPTNMNFLF